MPFIRASKQAVALPLGTCANSFEKSLKHCVCVCVRVCVVCCVCVCACVCCVLCLCFGGREGMSPAH